MEPDALTITVLGCGTMGVAILSGILSSLDSLRSASASGTSTPNALLPTRFHDVDNTPPRLPSRFIACVKRPESGERVRKAFGDYEGKVKVLTKGNVEGATLGDVVILACKPQMHTEILGEEGMAKALEGKLLVSILAGVKIAQLKGLLHESTRVVRAMPNTASKVCLDFSIPLPVSLMLAQFSPALCLVVYTLIFKIYIHELSPHKPRPHTRHSPPPLFLPRILIPPF